MADPGSLFSPDGQNAATMADQIKAITLKAGWLLQVDFTSVARYENAIVVYNDPYLAQVAVRGNRNYGLGQLVISPAANDRLFYLTGWHKDAYYATDYPWVQSRMRVDFDNGFTVAMGYEDGSDNDFNDIRCTLRFINPNANPGFAGYGH